MDMTYTLDMNAPLAQAFDAVDNDDKMKIWMKGLESTTYHNEAEIDMEKPVGLKFTQRIKEGKRVTEYSGEILAYEKLNYVAVQIGNKMFTMKVHYRFEATGEHTSRLNYQLEGTMHNWFARLMGWLFKGMTRRILKKQMAGLKQVAEQG